MKYMCATRKKGNMSLKKRLHNWLVIEIYYHGNVEFSCHIVAGFDHKMVHKNYFSHQP